MDVHVYLMSTHEQEWTLVESKKTKIKKRKDNNILQEKLRMPILSYNNNMYAGYTLLCYALPEDLVTIIFSCLTGVKGNLQNQRKLLHDKYVFDNNGNNDQYDFDDWSECTENYYYYNPGYYSPGYDYFYSDWKYAYEDKCKLTYDTSQLTDLYYSEKDSRIKKYNKSR